MALSPITLLLLQDKSLSSSIPFEFMCVRGVCFFKLFFMEKFKFIQELHSEFSYTPNPVVAHWAVLSLPLRGSVAGSLRPPLTPAPGGLWDLSCPEIEPRTLGGKVWSPNHWTTREFPLRSVNSRRMGFPSRVEISFSMLSSPFIRFISHVIVKQTSDITSFYLYFHTFVFLKGKSKWTREIV